MEVVCLTSLHILYSIPTLCIFVYEYTSAIVISFYLNFRKLPSLFRKNYYIEIIIKIGSNNCLCKVTIVCKLEIHRKGLKSFETLV